MAAAVIVWVMATACWGQQSWDRLQKWEYDEQSGRWVLVQPPSPGTPQGDLHAARLMVKNEEYKKGVDVLKKWEEKHGVGDTNFPAVLIALAQAQIGNRDYYKGYKTLVRFLNEFEGTELTHEALRLQFVIAEVYLSGVKRKVLGVRLLPADDVALRILDDISANYPGDELAEFAIKTKADYFMRTGDHELAELEYSRFLNEYQGSRYYPHVLFQAAVAALAQFGGTEYDEAPLIEAQGRYTDYIMRCPDDEQRDSVNLTLEEIRQKRAMKDFSIGQYYERTRHVRSAVFYYQIVCRDWPQTIAKTRAAARLEALGVAAPVSESPASPPPGSMANEVHQSEGD